MKIYLCGPINGCTDQECKDWRETVKLCFRETIATIDPMRRDYRGKEDECFEQIVDGDYIDIREADALLVNAPGPSWGTAMEIHEACNQLKPIIVVVPHGSSISPWLRYHSTKIVHSFDEAIALIHELDSILPETAE